jgi:hypothetical protein
MTVAQEHGMEHAIDPTGASGQQWAAYDAMFSPLDGTTKMPRPMCDWRTGAIDRAVVEAWSQFDITRMVTGDWPKYGPIVMQRMRLFCGEEDSFYLENAVGRFKAQVEAAAEQSGGWDGPGYVKLIEYASHGNLERYVFADVNEQMREHLRKNGLAAR